MPVSGPTALMMIAVGAIVAGSVISAYGALKQGQAAKETGKLQEKLADQQATVTEQQAQSERVVAGQQEGDFRRQQSALMARRRAILGGSGIDQATGSPLLVSEDFRRETELQALRIRAGGEISATRLEQQAGFQRFQGSLLRFAGDNALVAGRIRAGSSLLTGAGTAFAAGAGGGGGAATTGLVGMRST